MLLYGGYSGKASTPKAEANGQDRTGQMTRCNATALGESNHGKGDEKKKELGGNKRRLAFG